MGIYDNDDDRPSILSEFINIFYVLLVFRLGELCQCFPTNMLHWQ